MTAAVGLDCLPRPVALLLGEAAGNPLAVSNRLDELLAGDGGALDAIVRGEGEGDRIVHDLLAVVGASKRDGPGRGPLIELGQAVDDVLDALERRPKRAGRAWLLVEQPDTELAIRGHELLELAEDLERACGGLRARLHAMTLSSSGL